MTINKEIKTKLENKLYQDILEFERFKTYAEQLINKIHTSHCVLVPQSEIAVKEFGISYGSILSTIAFYLEQYEIQQNQHKECDAPNNNI
jgi:hypothetical protein